MFTAPFYTKLRSYKVFICRGVIYYPLKGRNKLRPYISLGELTFLMATGYKGS